MLDVDVPQVMTIKTLKTQISKRSGVAIEKQIVYIRGTETQDDDTIYRHQFQDNELIDVFVLQRPRKNTDA